MCPGTHREPELAQILARPGLRQAGGRPAGSIKGNQAKTLFLFRRGFCLLDVQPLFADSQLRGLRAARFELPAGSCLPTSIMAASLNGERSTS